MTQPLAAGRPDERASGNNRIRTRGPEGARVKAAEARNRSAPDLTRAACLWVPTPCHGI